MKKRSHKNTLTCVYCSQEYPAGTPASGPEVSVLTEHIKVCEKHPMRDAERKITLLRVALEGLVGAASKSELEGMLKAIEIMPDCDEARAAKSGINALLVVMG